MDYSLNAGVNWGKEEALKATGSRPNSKSSCWMVKKKMGNKGNCDEILESYRTGF